jgi:NAD(P)-dependent dehydrogenase (short-subunit alcohol dehydrogenase family)
MRTWTPLILMAGLAACGLLDSEPKTLRQAYERQGSTPLPPLIGNRVDVAIGSPSAGTPLKTDAVDAAPQIDPAELDRYLRRFAREIGEPHVAVFGILNEDGTLYRYAYARLRFGAGETGQRVVTYVVPDTASRVMRIAAAIIPADPSAESRYLAYIHPGKRMDRNGMKKSTGASIINIASIYGQLGPDWRLYDGTEMGNPAAYSSSKGGLIQLTRWLSTTLTPSVRANVICPGGIFRNQPEMFVSRYEKKTPLGRMATEDDLRGTLGFLASDLSQYLTGQVLTVDGGLGVL